LLEPVKSMAAPQKMQLSASSSTATPIDQRFPKGLISSSKLVRYPALPRLDALLSRSLVAISS
jgi:hypothetical protein